MIPYSNKDYIEITEKFYNENEKNIENGEGTKTKIILNIIKYKNDLNNRYLKEIEETKDNRFKLPKDYELLCKYYITKLSYNDKELYEENEIFDCYKIENIGYYEITDYYKSMNIKIEYDKELIKKIDNYQKNYKSIVFDFTDDEFLDI